MTKYLAVLLMLIFVGSASAQDAVGPPTCRQMVEEAINARVLALMPLSGAVVRVQVDHVWWNTIDASSKRGVVYAIECAVAGPGKQLLEVELISSQTGQIVASKAAGGTVQF